MTMTVADSRVPSLRQHLHLYIDPYPYHDPVLDISPGPDESPSPSPSSHPSPGTAGTSSTDAFDTYICSVICMYDFRSDDPDHLSFRKNEILDIVKQEETGWWAAMRKDQDKVGWIPRAFVQTITDTMAEKLWNTVEELRVYEYEAEQLYVSAPTHHMQPLYDIGDPTPFPISTNARRKHQVRKDTKTSSPQRLQANAIVEPKSYNLVNEHVLYRGRPPPSPLAPMPQPSVYSIPLYNKPTPPTPPPSQDDMLQSGRGRDRAGSLPVRNAKRPSTAGDMPSKSNLSVLREFPDVDNVYHIPHTSGSVDLSLLSRTRSQKWKQVMGLDDSLNDVPPRPALPRYLRPIFGDDLVIGADGVRAGTLDALVEKLTYDMPIRDPSSVREDIDFCNTFLMTFRTFTTADILFDKLVDRYAMEPPEALTSNEFENWKKHLIANRRRVLMIFTMWLEDHRLLEEEPHIAQQLSDFLKLIKTLPLVSSAKRLLDSIERLTFADPTVTSPVSPRKARKARPHKNDLLRLDPIDIAEQLALIEFKKYVKITPQECIRYVSVGTQASPNVSNFICTHDKLVDWVKISILTNDALGRRADTIDFWIKVAEKCKQINNIASMSAILNALSSAVITRLHLTWAHVGRKSSLDGLLHYSEPSGGFAAYKKLLSSVEGPCVPFIGMYLTDIAHIQDSFSDEGAQICFLQRRRWYHVVTAIVRYQPRVYYIVESETTLSFINKHLQEEPNRDHDWFWSRSQDVQHTELAHADIRKGLEAAGF
ncbi:ras guanine nucleotide exchange factor domain-containing protein [Collybia nuda]|uniref:Ras guanine nucleotide exchange factor domain-containing protein n=1 Tax=Collybia nuda TaxID=64659 RepID=A0A9P5YJF1_9AGAR|nr:ras guanine nucleotide exchange factor domain-containing protein [Collybia nuda]